MNKIPLLTIALAASFAAVLGGTAGFLIGLVLVATPLSRLLGPRLSEFDFFGVILVTVGGGGFATLAAPIYTLMTLHWKFLLRPWVAAALVSVPAILFWSLTWIVDPGMIWAAALWIAVAVGSLLGTQIATCFSRAKSEPRL